MAGAAGTVRRIGVIFGGRSVEHEVSVITAHQGMDALEVAGFIVLPIYISKSGYWYAGEALRDLRQFTDLSRDFTEVPGVHRLGLSPDRGLRTLVPGRALRGLFSRPPALWADVFFPMTHGSFGEDGTLAGLLEMADVPYVGSGILASALGMNKAMMKRIARTIDLPVLDAIVFDRETIRSDAAGAAARAEAAASFPLIVKPVHLGSSIGVRRCTTLDEVAEALIAAALLDSEVLIEPALSDFAEINCAVIGPPEEASVCEQPVTDAALLSFDEKYRRGGKSPKRAARSAGMASMGRVVPAAIPDELAQLAQRHAVAVFRTIGASGVARIDFLYDKATSRLYFNEINTVPGSLAFYLWEAAGLPFDQLVSRLVETALSRARQRAETTFTFDANLLSP